MEGSDGTRDGEGHAGPASLRRQGDVAVVTIDNPPVNATSLAVRRGLLAALAATDADPEVRAVVIAGAGRTFVAGADIREIGRPPEDPVLPAVTAAIEDGRKPVVAALHGSTLGGGLELALACHGRVAAPGSTLGLPEVKLGVIPGAGGTQRLPRLIGIPAAMTMIAEGRTLTAETAAAAGLVDRLADGDLVAAAVDLARALAEASGGNPPARTRERPVPAFDRAAALAEIERIERKARGQAAPGLAARAVLSAADLPFAEALARERATFLDLSTSDEAEALRHLFFAERAAGRPADGRPEADSPPRTVTTVGIAGCGLMGSGIAAAFANAGLAVMVADPLLSDGATGRARIAGLYERMLASGRIDAAEAERRMARITVSTDLGSLGAADLVVEAVYDDLAVKQALFRELSALLRPEAILATNTSYLDPDRIAEAADDPARVVGLHFFSPASVMRLVEVVRCARTAPDVLATAVALARRIGKLPVVCGVGEGFIGNRLFTALRDAAEPLLLEGALPETVDAALEGFGFPMGPFAVSDMAGLDISFERRRRKAAAEPGSVAPVIADRLCEAGRFGRKTGAGWYVYDGDHRRPDPAVKAIVEAASEAGGIARRRVTAEEIVSRLIDALRREGERLLEEGIAASRADIDLVMVHGYGYPAWRGGPMFRPARG